MMEIFLERFNNDEVKFTIYSKGLDGVMETFMVE